MVSGADCCKTSGDVNFGASRQSAENDASDDFDEIWADEEPDFSAADIKRNHTKQGYLDGLTQAQESSLQRGFDEGYPKGASLAVRVGAILATLYSYDSKLYNEAKSELNITRVLDKKYFDDSLELANTPDVITKWQAKCESLQS